MVASAASYWSDAASPQLSESLEAAGLVGITARSLLQKLQIASLARRQSSSYSR